MHLLLNWIYCAPYEGSRNGKTRVRNLLILVLMGKTKRIETDKLFQEPTYADELKWSKLKKQRAKCIKLWKKVVRTDAAVDVLCAGADSKPQYDPIAMILACMKDVEKFEAATDPVWKVALEAAKAQLKFSRYSTRIVHKKGVPLRLINRTVDASVPEGAF